MRRPRSSIRLPVTSNSRVNQPGAHPELVAATRQVGERRDLLGQEHRVPDREHQDARREPYPRGQRRRPRHDAQGLQPGRPVEAGRRQQVVDHPDVEAVLLALLDRAPQARSTCSGPRSSATSSSAPTRPSAARPSAQLRVTVVAELEGRAAARHAVGAVRHPGRPARVHPGAEGLLLAEVDQLALDDPDLLPEVVGDRPRCLDARVEAKQPRLVAGRRIAGSAPSGRRPARRRRRSATPSTGAHGR